MTKKMSLAAATSSYLRMTNKKIITYGSSFQALQNAVKYDTKIILMDLREPPIYINPEERQKWAILYMKLMLNGNVIGGDSVLNCKLDDEAITAVSKRNVINKIEYDEMHMFTDKNIIGLPDIDRQITQYQVIDYLVPHSLSMPHLTHIKTQDKLVAEIFIHKPNSKRATEIYAFSTLEEKQLHDFDYSDTMVQFKCEDILKTHGFKGAKNGKHKLLLKLESRYRDVIKPMQIYKDTPKVKFFNGNKKAYN